MTRFSRLLFGSMCSAFGLCCLGMLAGLVHGIYATFCQHRSIEDILGNSIPYYQAVGAIGVAGFLLFLAFLVSSISGSNKRNHSK